MPSHNSVRQRIRDPIHNLIEFDTRQQLERLLWKVLCSQPFQRLRRIKQLGFSELVYPGATHSRFAHSIGVFQTARELMGIVRKWTGENRMEAQEQIALAAALVHDVGHGPFSHAFEFVGKKLDLKLAGHEQVSDQLIRESEIAEILYEFGSGFANDVANVINKDGRQTVYNAVVSSQFDADRLDYMRRDRLMTGTQQSAIDLKWLLANLEIADVSVGVDDMKFADVPTFVIGPKAIPAAESYVLGNFQLYPAVYFHKTTRGAEKLFAELLVRLVELVQNGSGSTVGLENTHPLVQFASTPDVIDTVMKLDDTVIWGALSQLRESKDQLLSSFAGRLQDRKLFKCIDIRTLVHHRIDPENVANAEHIELIDYCCGKILHKLGQLREERMAADGIPAILTDEASRSPYKTRGESLGPVERINVRTEGGALIDLKQRSKVVASLQDFTLTRAYFDPEHPSLERDICAILEKEVNKC